jgi:hypothetical protein
MTRNKEQTQRQSPGEDLGRTYLGQAQRQLDGCLAKIKHCLKQLDEEQIWWRPRESANSIANLTLHLCGNVRQWIISGVGGAPDLRNRPREFSERGPMTKAQLTRRLEETVHEANHLLSKHETQAALLAPRRIQGFDETVLSAILNSVAHFAGHTQEIICLTRFQLGDGYRFLWVPKTSEQGAPVEDYAEDE